MLACKTSGFENKMCQKKENKFFVHHKQVENLKNCKNNRTKRINNQLTEGIEGEKDYS